MLTLSLDTSSNLLSVALLENDIVLAHKEETMTRGHGEALIPFIEDLFKSVSKDISTLNAVAVGVGPGSFTGVRVGLAAARGIGMSLNIPVWGVNGFEAFSFGADKPVIVALDTKRGDYYTQAFRCSLQPISVPCIQTTEQLKEHGCVCICSDVASQLSSQIDCSVISLADSLAVRVAKVALLRTSTPLLAEPLYLREADVTL